VAELFASVSDRGLVLGLWTRRAFVTLFALVCLLGLLDVFGQRAVTSDAASPAARMSLPAPRTVRGGLLYQSRIDIRATQPIDHPPRPRASPAGTDASCSATTPATRRC
jgi:hypothetical protein